MRRGNCRVALAAVALATATALASCGGGATTLGHSACPSATALPVANGTGLTLAQLTDRVAEAATCSGYALRLKSSLQIQQGPTTGYGDSEIWVDLAHNLGRRETRSAGGKSSSGAAQKTIDAQATKTLGKAERRIVRGDGDYTAHSDGAGVKNTAPACRGAGRAALVLLVECLRGTETIDLHATFNGHAAVAIVSDQTIAGQGATVRSAGRSYFDQRTLLPIGKESTATGFPGGTVESKESYGLGFVPLASLPADFFNPASIGLVERSPDETLDALTSGVKIYWLGRQIAGSEGFPSLILDHASPGLAPEPYAAEITYRAADGSPVTLKVYKRDKWDAFLAQSFGGNWWDGSCVTHQDLDVPGGKATIYSGYAFRPCSGQTMFLAHVFIGETVVQVDAPGVLEGAGRFVDSPYDSVQGMELLARSLTPRQ